MPVFVSEGVLDLMVVGGTVDDLSAGASTWRSARQCESGACVEIGTQGEFVVVRSSADPDGPRLTLRRDRWQEFVAGLKRGKFDGL
jgi:Domain of unknown function (DUF397)